MHDSDPADAGSAERMIGRPSPGAEAGAFLHATRDFWPKDLKITEGTKTNNVRLDLVLSSRNKPSLLAEVRRLGRPGSYPIESAASRAAIWMRDSAFRANLLVLIVPELSKRTLVNAMEGLERIRTIVGLPNVAIFSHRGGHYLAVSEWGLHSERVDNIAANTETIAERPGNSLTFSEANEQLLKVLLYETVRAGEHAAAVVRAWWPRHPAPLISVEQWAEATEVGRTTAYRLYQQLRDLGWISEVDRITPLRLLNLPHLLSSWLEAHRTSAPRQFIPISPLYPRKDTVPERDQHVQEWLRQVAHEIESRGGMLVLSGWKALDVHKLGIVVGKRPYTVEVPINRYVKLVTEAALVPTHRNPEPWAYLGVMSHWRAVAMGTVRRSPKSLAIVDPWQAALDVAGDPNGGHEQAEAVRDRIIRLAAIP